MSPSSESVSGGFADRWLPGLVYLATALVFLPVLHWLASRAAAQEQLLHAFLVFLFTGALLAIQRQLDLRPVLRFTDTCLYLLLGSYGLLAVAALTKINLTVLAALCLFLASFLLFLLGDGKRRFIYSSVAAFALFTAFALLMPVLDWPLRTVAGRCSAFGLGLFGQETALGLVGSAEGPKLILLNEGVPFHVAAECNGFGILSSCLLMAVILVLYQPMPWTKRLGGLVLAALFGFLFNTIRIVVIVLLAPVVPDHYMLMHEAVGLATTYLGLGILFVVLTRGWERRSA